MSAFFSYENNCREYITGLFVKITMANLETALHLKSKCSFAIGDVVQATVKRVIGAQADESACGRSVLAWAGSNPSGKKCLQSR
jgi:hypothetical protein